ncbi:hypothetical protein Tco_0594698 [Tanacetum coccineum]
MSSYYEKVATMRRSLEIDDMLRIRLRDAESNEDIFTYVAWIRAFNIKEPIYAKLCQEFYSTYEFDEVCDDDELQSKKIIKFRLGRRAHNLTLLEFTRRLGLYHADELVDDEFDVYFQGGLHSDDNFNAQEYWLSISKEESLGLSRSHASTIRNPILRVIHKLITYGLCQRTTRYDKIQKNDLWLLSMFDARHQNGYANVAWLITRQMKRKGAGTQRESQICCGQDLDTTTQRELIDSEGRLILEDLQPGVPRVGIPRPSRASMHDLYQGVFEHMVGVYSVSLQGTYNPPGYAQPPYDQYYQQYQPPPPQSNTTPPIFPLRPILGVTDWHQRASYREPVKSSTSNRCHLYLLCYTDSEPGRVFWGADEEISDGGVPRVIVLGYDGLPMQPVHPASPDYVPGPEHPASPDYVPGPEHPPSPIEIPFVPEPEYPEYLVPSEDEAPMEDPTSTR